MPYNPGSSKQNTDQNIEKNPPSGFFKRQEKPLPLHCYPLLCRNELLYTIVDEAVKGEEIF